MSYTTLNKAVNVISQDHDKVAKNWRDDLILNDTVNICNTFMLNDFIILLEYNISNDSSGAMEDLQNKESAFDESSISDSDESMTDYNIVHIDTNDSVPSPFSPILTI